MFPVDFAIFSPPIRRCAQCSHVRTNGSPVAASDWAISSSWCGNTRSTPPVWTSNDDPRLRHAHGRALDVPAGPAGPDRRVPRRLAGLRTLPHGEVADVVLAVLVGLDPLARPASPRGRGARAARRRARTRCGRRSSRRRCGTRGPCRAASAPARRSAGCARSPEAGRPAASSRAHRHPRGIVPAYRSASSVVVIPSAAAPRMILSSMSVRFMTHVTARPAVAQIPDQQVGEQERAEVADVRGAIHRRPAAVDADPARLDRLERPRPRR